MKTKHKIGLSLVKLLIALCLIMIEINGIKGSLSVDVPNYSTENEGVLFKAVDSGGFSPFFFFPEVNSELVFEKESVNSQGYCDFIGNFGNCKFIHEAFEYHKIANPSGEINIVNVCENGSQVYNIDNRWNPTIIDYCNRSILALDNINIFGPNLECFDNRSICMNFSVEDGDPFNGYKRDIQQSEDGNIYGELKLNSTHATIYIKVIRRVSGYVSMNQEKLKVSYNTSGVYTIMIPENLREYDFFFSLFLDDGTNSILLSEKFYGYKTCYLSNDIFSFSTLSSLRCLPVTGKIFTILSIIVLFLIAIFSFVSLVIFIIQVFKVVIMRGKDWKNIRIIWLSWLMLSWCFKVVPEEERKEKVNTSLMKEKQKNKLSEKKIEKKTVSEEDSYSEEDMIEFEPSVSLCELMGERDCIDFGLDKTKDVILYKDKNGCFIGGELNEEQSKEMIKFSKRDYLVKKLEPKIRMKSRNIRKPIKFASPKGHFSIIALLIFCLIGNSYCVTNYGRDNNLECSKSIVLLSNLTECVNTGESRLCKIITEGTTYLSKLESTCLHLVEDKTNRFIKTYRVNLLNKANRYSKTLKYKTSDWFIATESHKRCYKAGKCPSNCDGLGNYWDNGLGLIPGNYQYKYSYCYRTAGGWANGCFLDDDGCLYAGWVLSPGVMRYNVYKIGLEGDSYYLELSDYDNKDNLVNSSSVVLDGLEEGKLGNKFTIHSLSQGKDFNPLDYNHLFSRITFIGEGKKPTIAGNYLSENYLYHASDAGIPKISFPGDYQYSTNKFDPIFNNEAIKVTPEVHRATYEWETPGINLIRNGIELPGYSSYGEVVLTNEGKLYEVLNDSINNLFYFNFQDEIKISQTIDEVCPVKSGETKVVGCYNCEFGASLNVTLKSSCEPGTCYLFSKELIIVNKIIVVNKVNKEIEIRFKSSEKEINTTVTVNCPGNSESNKLDINVIGVLDEYIKPIISSNQTSSSGDFVKGEKPCDVFCKIRKGEAKWSEYLVFSIITAIASIVLITVISKLLVWSFRKKPDSVEMKLLSDKM
jgi:hypothetical protein